MVRSTADTYEIERAKSAVRERDAIIADLEKWNRYLSGLVYVLVVACAVIAIVALVFRQ